MSSAEKPSVAFALSLIAGLLILVGGTTAFLWASSGIPMWGGMMGGMMSGYQSMMGGMGLSGGGLLMGMGLFGIVAGVSVILGSLMLYNRPSEASIWGIVVLIFSVVSLFGMGGFFIGAVVGIIGGILALTWKPSQRQTPSLPPSH